MVKKRMKSKFPGNKNDDKVGSHGRLPSQRAADPTSLSSFHHLRLHPEGKKIFIKLSRIYIYNKQKS